MAFKRSNIPGEDIRLAMEMTSKRRKLIDEAPAAPIIYEYGVNRLAKALHPGVMEARITAKEPAGLDCCRITLMSLRDDGKFPYFRAGQFVTLSARAGGSFLSRPYSIASSPKAALEGILEIIVQRKGVFSSYLIDETRNGDRIWVSEPSGDFCYDDLRDKEHILAVAGGSGVTPFLSMMEAIREGSEDFRLTLIYGARTRKHLLFDPADYKDGRIEIVPVLSEEEAEGYPHGFINAEIMKRYIGEGTSIFLCGPDAMYRFVGKELESLGIRAAEIRKERNSVGNRAVSEEIAYTLTVHIRDKVYNVTARNEETIITALERAGIPAVVRCRNGSCGFCHSRVIAGEYYVPAENDLRRSADKKFGYIHPCSTYPLSDMEIDVPIFEL